MAIVTVTVTIIVAVIVMSRLYNVVSTYKYSTFCPNSDVYITAIAPRVQYGSIVCLQTWNPVMTSIPKEEVDRMPGKTTAEKCAWAARTRQNFLFAVKTKSEECTSSKFTYPENPPTVLNNLAQKRCSGRNGERVLYFVGGIHV